MSLESEIKELRRKRIEEGVKTRKLTDTVKTDIAPLREKEDTSGLFKAGTLDDSFNSLGDALALGGTATLGDISAAILQGVGGLVEGVTDLGAYGVSGILHATGNHSAAWDVKNLAKEDTVAGFMNDIRDKSGISEYSFLGDFGYDVASGAGYITGLAAGGALAKAVGVTGKGLSAVSKIIMGLSGMGSGMSEAYSNGATDGEAAAYGAMSAGAEVLSEMMFSGLGSAFQKLGVGTGLIDLDDVITKKLTKNITNNAVKNLLQLGIKASGEGIEEVVSGFLSSLAKKITYKSEEDYGKILADEDLLKQAFSGFLVSLISQSGDVMSSTSQGREFVTGLTDNEQKVVDKVYENRVTEAEKDGKLTSKEKAKIYDEVMEDLKEGGIDIDTIEEVLGGETYKNYKNTVESEDALKKELDALRQMKKSDMNDIQSERLEELKGMNLSDTSKRDSLKSQLGNEVFNLAKDGYLAESYNERARRGEKFTVDLTKYNGKQAEIVQKAIDSGFLNNTRKTHAMVDLIAKVGGDKDIDFDFTNNEKLKNSGFAVGGKIVNGYVTKDGITVNINSKKALNSVVGHEITHVLEGTELYSELQKAVYDYANAKGDYQSKRADIEKLYKDIKDADVDAELTADLVGDYLFTDTDFVRSLSTKNRSLFEKLFDEIKYLCKIATAGSKEARQLEAVKKAFQEAYRESGKSTRDDMNSLKQTGENATEQPTEVNLSEKLSPEDAQAMNIMASNIVKAAKTTGLFLDDYYKATENINAFNPTRADANALADALAEYVEVMDKDIYRGYLEKIREFGGGNELFESNDVSYSLGEIIGESGENYGIGVHLDSTLLTNLTDEERIEMVKEYVKELGGSVFTAYDGNQNPVDVHIVEYSKKFKNKSGKRIPVTKDLSSKYIKNKVKQESIALVDELLITSTYDAKKSPGYPHDWIDNYGKNDWEYWTTYLQDKDNNIWRATLNVANAENGEKILYDINPIKKVERSVKSDTISTDNIIPQTEGKVNTFEEKNQKNSLSFEDEAPTRIRGGIYGEDVILKDAPMKETVVEETPIAPIRSDVGAETGAPADVNVTENAEIIPNGTRVTVSDRDNVGTVQGYNPKTKEYTVFFRGKNGTATKTFPASMVSSLNPTPSVDQATSYTKSRTGTSEGEKKKPKSVLEWFRRTIIDKHSVFEDLALKTGNRAVMDKAYTMLLSRQKAQHLIEKGDTNKGVKALADIREAVKKDGHYDDFVDYMLHKHNIDRMSIKSNAMNSVNHLEPKFGHLGKDQIYAIANTEITPNTTPKTAQTINEAKEYLSALNTKNKAVFDDSVTADVSRKAVNDYEKKYPQFKKFADDVYAYNKHLLNMLVDEGILTQDTADLWANMYPNHVPIVRVDKEGNPVVSLGKRGTGVNAPIKKATGGNGVIQDLFKSLADRTAQTIKAVDTDRFGHELRQTINANVVQDQNNTGDVDEILNSPDKILTPGLDGNSATFGIYENGKRVDFEISEEMYNALKPVSDDLAREIPVISTLSKARRAMLTSLSPMFAIKNPIRDLQDVFVNSKHPVETYKNLPRAIKELAKNEGYAAEYAKNGGISGEAYDSDTKAFKEAKKGIMKYVGIPIDKLKGAGEFVETAPRLAEYIASRESGESVEASMLDAARVTTNFVAGGDVTKFLNRNGFTFLNASVQGAAQQVRNVREAKANGVKGMLTLGAKTMAAGLPLLIANALIWGDDEDYEELPSYIKDNYYIIAKFGDQFVRIPKGRAIAVIQKAFDSMGDVITGNDEVDYDTFGELLWNNFVDTFKLGISNLAPNNPIDNNIIAPIVQAHTGEAWYGDDIVPERLQDLPAGEQYDENIDLLSKWLGEKTTLSPYKINYLLDQYTGAFGDFALPMLTPKAESDAGILAPFKNEFVVDSTVKNSNATNFFNKVDELKVKSNSAKATDSDILKSKYMDAINSELSELYKQKRNVQNSTLSDKQKYAAVKALQQQINDLCKEGLESYKNVIIDGKYATVADMHFRYTDDGKWSRIDDEQLEKQKAETARLGITPADYWRNYTLSNVVGENYKTYSSEIKDITSDKNANGDTVKDSRKKKVVAYINGLNVDYGEKLLIYKTEYPADDSYNYEIVDYLNSRDDLTTNDIRAILGRLGFDIDEDGRVSWD